MADNGTDTVEAGTPKVIFDCGAAESPDAPCNAMSLVVVSGSDITVGVDSIRKDDSVETLSAGNSRTYGPGNITKITVTSAGSTVIRWGVTSRWSHREQAAY